MFYSVFCLHFYLHVKQQINDSLGNLKKVTSKYVLTDILKPSLMTINRFMFSLSCVFLHFEPFLLLLPRLLLFSKRWKENQHVISRHGFQFDVCYILSSGPYSCVTACILCIFSVCAFSNLVLCSRHKGLETC
jgi:hypothetical protein